MGTVMLRDHTKPSSGKKHCRINHSKCDLSVELIIVHVDIKDYFWKSYVRDL